MSQRQHVLQEHVLANPLDKGEQSSMKKNRIQKLHSPLPLQVQLEYTRRIDNAIVERKKASGM